MAQGVKTGGRKKGTPNRSTADAREAIARFAQANIPKIAQWVNQVASGDEKRAADPGRAAEITLRAIEYHIPKLGRTELTGADGEKLSVSVQINRTVKDKDQG